MNYTIFDIETDGFNYTKIHCLSFIKLENGIVTKGTITNYIDMSIFLEQQEILIGHFIVNFDIPALEQILNIKIQKRLICTLAISYYLYPIAGFKHGLELWGERLGFPKPKIEDWENLPIEEYIKRCESDVEINFRLFNHLINYLKLIYCDALNQIDNLLNYLTYKMSCVREQEVEKIHLDQRLAKKCKFDLEFLLSEKRNILENIMPKMVKKDPPKIMYKKGGEISANGIKWYNLLETLNLSKDSKAIYENGNPGSPTQLTKWLFSLGWKPETFKTSKKTKKELPQVSLPHGKGICPSVKALYTTSPNLEELENYYKIRHRVGLFKSFLEHVDENGKIVSSMAGFTNTLRLMHKAPVANLPKINLFYGKEIRGCLVVPDNTYIMFGSDISGLEDNTKQHYMFSYDPDYVIQMRAEGFDPHLDIGVFAGIITEEDSDNYKRINAKKNNEEKLTKDEKLLLYQISIKRGNAKVINFSGVYGAGPAKIADTLGCSLEFAKKLHTAYWKRNWSVKKIASDSEVKYINKQRWIYNPTSKFWLFLKDNKDRFSTLNQSTGVFVFDNWVRNVRQRLNPLGIRIGLQYHDEVLGICKKKDKNIVNMHLKEAMVETNNQLKLNVTIRISVDWGNCYADCH